MAAETHCFNSPTPSGNGTVNNGNGGDVVAFFLNAAGLYVIPWLYIVHGGTQKPEWVAANTSQSWYGPLAARDSQAPGPWVDWHVNPGHESWVRVLRVIADANTREMRAGWAPTLIEGFVATTWCQYP